MTKFFIQLINIYQALLSPDHSFWGRYRFPYGYCRFYPSCSEYSRQSLKKYGLIRGLAKGFSRILRCNPFSKGGLDLLK